ncbi:solute carrier family 66 member 2-like isoform X1 [Lineus longissimus]|uniref:solute carrier family 66 member 2-like isoform X1 n=1 Tax=Lineus longissimus TaxID=88925 RepID=UPI002B4F6997
MVFLSVFDVLLTMIAGVTLSDLVAAIAAGAMIFGGIVPFIPQYREIKGSGNAEGFSLFVCLTLLIANILRIFFWFGKHFELPLLLQSIVMTLTMLVMVEMCVTVKNKSDIIAQKSQKFLAPLELHKKNDNLSADDSVEGVDTVNYSKESRSFLDFNWKYFWKWTHFSSYLQFLLLFSAVVGLMTYLMLNVTVYIETLGFLAVFAEALLGAPQFYRNFIKKSTAGMSKKMVFFWTCGDIFKTCYFLIRAAPAQFWICGMLQVSIDISIFIQVYYYGLMPHGIF